MNVLSHALLPALAAAPLLPRRTPREFYAAAGIVALAGALPDVLHPHLSLAARYASWSHTVFAFTGGTMVFVLLAMFARRRLPLIALLLAPVAYASHLGLDGLSGGVAWLYPLSREVLSHRLIRYPYWFPIDVVLAATASATVLWMRWRFWTAESAGAAAQPRPSDRVC
ncbi:metal-dependent hydrolase [Opitutus terrae]|uniref:Membrane-bound metal-dependent hydrolase n=1 Tax=Opitutus terrae (strain DSM 11246 / JCM 15787 / PB90-1) TaxID=452637 RepID=B1ZX36_OPITP|nr:metal-dependent hydrolase [Opitutus terrae]ACB75143.1 membrane-bound metal-dependent hydrolase [Opitutus terrae PB90-1]